MKKLFVAISLAITSTLVSFVPAQADVATVTTTWASTPVAGQLSPAATVSIHINEVPVDDTPTGTHRRIGSYQIGFNDPDTSASFLANFPYPTYLCYSVSDSNCPIDSSTVTLASDSTTVPLPLSFIRDWNANTGFLIQFTDDTNEAWGGLVVGDVVHFHFRAGAFTVPLSGGNFKAKVYTGWVQYTSTDAWPHMKGENGYFPYSPADATLYGDSQSVAAGSAIAPNAPSVNATAGLNKATVSVQPPSSGGIPVTYEVVSEPGGFTCTATYPAMTCDVTGLTAGTDYKFKVRAVNTVGPSSWSVWSPIVTPVSGAPGALVAPTGTPANASINAQGIAPLTGGSVYKYYIRAYDGATQAGQCTAISPATSCVITGLTNGTAYTLKQLAQNGAGFNTGSWSVASDPITPLAELDTPPSAPGTPTVTAGNSTASLSWTASETGTTPITYEVISSPAGASCTIVGVTATCTGLTNLSTYRFQIKATNSVGTSYSGVSNPVVPTGIASIAPSTPTMTPTEMLGTGANRTIRGTLLIELKKLKLNNSEIPFTLNKDATVSFVVPELPVGVYDMDLISATSTVHWVHALFVKASSVKPTNPTSGKSWSRVLAGFAGDSALLTKSLKASIKKALPGAKLLTCVGSTSNVKATVADKKLALARAKAACAYAKSISKSLITKAQAKPSIGIGAFARRVTLTFSK